MFQWRALFEIEFFRLQLLRTYVGGIRFNLVLKSLHWCWESEGVVEGIFRSFSTFANCLTPRLKIVN
jgi:hypothetical protein